MKQIKRVLSKKAAERLRQHLQKKKYVFRNRFGGYVEAIHYTTNGRLKVHFLFLPSNLNGGSIVKFHIDKVYEKYHKLSTDPKDYEDILEWLELPSDLAFDLTGVFRAKGKGT